MNKIVFIFEGSYGTTNDYKHFGMKEFEDRGYQVEVWTTVKWSHGDIPKPHNVDESSRTHYIDNVETLETELERVKGDKCVFLIYYYHRYGYMSYIIRKKITKRGFEFCNVTMNPSIYETSLRNQLTFDVWIVIYNELKKIYFSMKPILKKVIKLPVSKDYQNDIKEITQNWKDSYARIFGPFIYKSKYNFVTVEIEYVKIPNLLECFSKRNILIHSNSYDEYLEIEKQDSPDEKEYVVFVDQYLMGHPDFINRNINKPIEDEKKYYGRLCQLFEYIEEEYACPVIIAAHPAAVYKGDEFGKRNIIHGATNRLVKDARLVIIQYSTTFGLITMCKKDFLNIYFEDFFINRPNLIGIYRLIEDEYHSKALNMNEEEEIRNWKNYVVKYNKEVFDVYKRELVISNNGIEGITFYSFIADKICK